MIKQPTKPGMGKPIRILPIGQRPIQGRPVPAPTPVKKPGRTSPPIFTKPRDVHTMLLR